MSTPTTPKTWVFNKQVYDDISKIKQQLSLINKYKRYALKYNATRYKQLEDMYCCVACLQKLKLTE